MLRTIATGKAKRNEFIEMLTALGDKYKKQKWGWTWSAAMRQEKLEKTLNVGGSGYPVRFIRKISCGS